MERYEAFNRALESRGDENGNRGKLDRSKILFCESCEARGRGLAPDARRSEVERLREVIVELKADPDPDARPDLVESLRKLGHPDPDGLMQCLREKAAGRKRGGASKGAV